MLSVLTVFLKNISYIFMNSSVLDIIIHYGQFGEQFHDNNWIDDHDDDDDDYNDDDVDDDDDNNNFCWY